MRAFHHECIREWADEIAERINGIARNLNCSKPMARAIDDIQQRLARLEAR